MPKKTITTLLVTAMIVAAMPIIARAVDITLENFELSTYRNEVLTFDSQDFLKSYKDNGEVPKPLEAVRIVSTPLESKGILKLGDEYIADGDMILVSELSKMTFVPQKDFVGKVMMRWNSRDMASTGATSTITISVIGTSENIPSDPTPKPFYYSDMAGHWGAYSAEMLAKNNIILGEAIQGRSYFYPDKLMNRGEFILFLNSTGKIHPIMGPSFFDDDIPSWLVGPANGAFYANVVLGTNSGEKRILQPLTQITRLEAVKMIDNCLKLPNVKVNNLEDFIDGGTVPEWGAAAMNNLLSYGIIKGSAEGYLYPNKKISRSEAAEMLWQMYKYRNEQKNLLLK